MRVVFHQENNSEVSVNMNNEDTTSDEDYLPCLPGKMDICCCIPPQEYSVVTPNTSGATTTYVTSPRSNSAIADAVNPSINEIAFNNTDDTNDSPIGRDLLSELNECVDSNSDGDNSPMRESSLCTQEQIMKSDSSVSGSIFSLGTIPTFNVHTYLDPVKNQRFVVELLLRAHGVIMTSFGEAYETNSYTSCVYSIEEEVTSIWTEGTELQRNHEPRRVYLPNGTVKIVDLPIHDPNSYDLVSEYWSESAASYNMVENAYALLPDTLKQGIKDAIMLAKQAKRGARRAYNEPLIQRSPNGTFEFTYLPGPVPPREIYYYHPLEDNELIQGNAADGHSIHLMQTRFLNKNSCRPKDRSSRRGEVLVDGGCDTSLVGNGFMVESTTSRKVSVQGFNDDMQLEALPIVTAITAVDLPSGTIIIELNEAIYVQGNSGYYWR